MATQKKKTERKPVGKSGGKVSAAGTSNVPAKAVPAQVPAKATPAGPPVKSQPAGVPAKRIPGKTPAARTPADPYSAALGNLGEIQLRATAKELEKRGFTTSVVSTARDAADLVLGTLLPDSGAKSVAFGGSMTVVHSGLYDALLKEKSGLTVYDTYDTSIGMPALIERRREALLADMYFCSANALTRDGVVLLLDGIGNRTASVQFGPRNVVLLIGRNKLCDTTEAAFARVKNVSAPANAVRLSRNTPCTKTGRCMDCKSPESVCAVWTVLRRCNPAGRIHVVLINEDVGF